MSAIRDGRVVVGGRKAHFAEAGSGRPVVVAPGLGLSTRFYEPALLSFARAGVRLIVPDLPGCGRTRGPVFGMSVGDVAAWLLEFATSVGVARPVWLGHSVGCQVALAIAASEPERAAALVLAAPTGAPVRLRLTRQLLALFAAAVREPPELLLAVLRDYVHVLPTAYVGTWLRAGRDNAFERAECVRCPTLILVGHRDPVVPRRYVERLAAGIPGARVAEVRGGNHGLPRDAAPAFAAAAAEFVKEVVGR